MDMTKGLQSGSPKPCDQRVESSFSSMDKLQVGLTYAEASSSLGVEEAEGGFACQFKYPLFFVFSGVTTVRGQCDFLLWPSEFSLVSLHFLSLHQSHL